MWLYRILLYCYPASFRAEYGDEMAAAFRARYGNGRGALATSILALADVVPNGIAAHWDILARDLKYTMRSLRRTPGFALTAVLVVAIGVGANAAAFSVANFVLLQPLPFPKPDQLVRVWETTPGYGQLELSPPNYRDWKASARSFSDMGAFTTTAANLTGSGEPRRLQIARLTWNVTNVLGVHAMLGRTFSAADTVSGQSALLSYDLWQTQFGGDASVIGKTIELDGSRFSVIGVMPRDFRFPSRDAELWTSLQFSGLDLQDRTNNYIAGVARLNNGVSVAQANTELGVIAKRLEHAYPKENQQTGANVYRMADDLGTRNRLLLYALCGAALCILLLACANLANLLLVRAMSRERELAVRAALGAGRDRLVRQLATESVVLAVLGAAAGLLVAVLAMPALARLVPTSLPIAGQPSLNAPVLILAGLLIVVTGVGFGVVPALGGSTLSLEALRDGGRSGGGRTQRMRSALVVVEVMASVILLVSSGLLMRSMWKLQSLDPGFRSSGVITVRTALPWPKYQDPLTRDVFYTHVLSDLQALPGVRSAAYASGVPMDMRGGIWPVVLRGDGPTRDMSNTASLRFVTPRYFATMSIPLQRGRDVAETDDGAHPYVAVVSESFVKRYWPNEDPIGQQFDFALHSRIVVGVVGDVRVRGFEQTSEPQVYVPPKQVDASNLIFYTPKDLVIRSSMPLASLMPDIRRIIRQADPQQPISNVRLLSDVVANDTASRAAQLRVLEILAAIALLLATVGIHGLLSFAVSRREQEIGVRVALGADPLSILSTFLREGLLLGIGGLVPGVFVAYLAGRAMQALLVNVSPSDPLTLVVGGALCAAATLAGCLRPAWRASRIDPITALRSQ